MVLITNNMPSYKYSSQDTLHPNFSDNGFGSEADALFWRDRSCGVACVQMLLNSYNNEQFTFSDLIQSMLSVGAYRPGVGWIHRGVAEFLQSFGFTAEARVLEIDELFTSVQYGKLAILSVQATLGMKRPIPPLRSERGGHLVLCHGYAKAVNEPESDWLVLSDPDYEFEDRQICQAVEIERIDRAWSGRAILIGPPMTGTSQA